MIYLKFCECISSIVVHVFHGADNAVSWQGGRTHVDPPTDYPDRPLPGVKPSPPINLLAIYRGPTDMLLCLSTNFPSSVRFKQRRFGTCVIHSDSGKRVGTK